MTAIPPITLPAAPTLFQSTFTFLLWWAKPAARPASRPCAPAPALMITAGGVGTSGGPMVEATQNPGLPLVCWYRSSPGLVRGTGLIAQLEVVFAGGHAGGDREGPRIS
jgi:hypothetical protein